MIAPVHYLNLPGHIAAKFQEVLMDNPYSILFEPVRIGPVTAPNRFYQVPHCNGFGHRMPQGLAAMRGMKAEGGWGVVCTEEVEIHHSSDLSPYFEGSLWNDDDIPALALMAEAVHKHGSLAGIELVYNGIRCAQPVFARAVPGTQLDGDHRRLGL